MVHNNLVFDIEYSYLFDTKQKDNLQLYFKFKNKNGYSFNQDEEKIFLSQIIDYLKTQIAPTDILIFPQTSNKCFLRIVGQLGNTYHILQKQNIKEVIQELDKQSMMKAEREKLYATLALNDTVKMANIAGNQRKRFINILFHNINNHTHKSYIFLDDSIFSGYTLAAAHQSVNQKPTKSIALFSK